MLVNSEQYLGYLCVWINFKFLLDIVGFAAKRH